MWYSTAIKPEKRIPLKDNKATIIIYKDAFAAHVLYNAQTGTVSNHIAGIDDLPLSVFDSWCTSPRQEECIK